jgi:hypothetical protein
MELTTDLVLREQTFESQTYQLSETKIEGFVDGLEALRQSIYKMLDTERFEYPIYSFNYGIAWNDLIGEEEGYIRAEAKRMIEEMLLEDDRIREVSNFAFEFSGDYCTCTFTVSSIYGETEIEKEVSV